ncbi:MAG TPA: hypothetical protein VF706_00685, partial [Solirubrobacteraceae bacterium]
MEIDVFTLFPEWFDWLGSERHVANALAAGSRLGFVNFRDHTRLSGGQVDDTPFGGGAGMVLRVDVVEDALRARYGVDPVQLRERRRVVALAPSGRLLDDALVDELAAEPALTLLCGRYEGFDERIVEHFATDAVSIGRYVLSGGELAAMVICDAVARKLPGALGDERLVEQPAAGRQRDHAAPRPQLDRVHAVVGAQRRVEHVDAEDHAGAAAEGRVVDLAARQRRMGAEVDGLDARAGRQHVRDV